MRAKKGREHMKIPGRTFVYSMLFIMTAINYLDRVNLSVAAKTIAEELSLTPIQLGWIFSAFLWSYIVVLIPAGYLADRFGARLLAPGAVAFWSLATASTAAVSGIVGLLAARICLGTGEAANAIEEFVPERLVGRMLGMGDILTLVEKAQIDFDETKAKKLQEKMANATFTLDTPVTTRFLLVWLTSVPAVTGGYQGKVAEIQVFG